MTARNEMKDDIRTEVRVERRIIAGTYAFYALRTDLTHRKLFQGQPVKLTEIEDGVASHIGPTMELSLEATQLLMDELWHVGIRPTEGTGSAGALAATQAHLKDMRQIATTLLEHAIKP